MTPATSAATFLTYRSETLSEAAIYSVDRTSLGSPMVEKTATLVRFGSARPDEPIALTGVSEVLGFRPFPHHSNCIGVNSSGELVSIDPTPAPNSSGFRRVGAIVGDCSVRLRSTTPKLEIIMICPIAEPTAPEFDQAG